MVPSSPARVEAIFNCVTNWVNSDPATALQWMSSLPIQEQKRIFPGLLPLLSKPEEFEPLLQYANSVGDPNLQSQIVARGVDILVSSGNLEAAKNWVLELPQSLRSDAQASLVSRDHQDSVDQLTPVALGITDQGPQMTALQSLAMRLFAQNPVEAGDWIARLPASAQFAPLIQLTFKWYNSDSVGLYQWVQSLPKGQLKDQAVKSVVSMAENSNPAFAKSMSQLSGK